MGMIAADDGHVDLIVTDAGRVDAAALTDYDLDLAFGDDENDFTLSYAKGPRLEAGCLVYMDGLGYGGMVGKVRTEKTGDTSTVTYAGPTWQGLLEQRVLCPDDGADYLSVSGEANQVLGQLVLRVGLGPLMRATAEPSGISIKSYRFDRYCDMWSGVRKMLATSGARLEISIRDGVVWLSAVRVVDWDGEVDSDRVDFDATRDWRPVNHLIGLGQGELSERQRVDWYADASGKVSQTQSLTGVDEVAQVYDYSNSEPTELSDKTREKLQELQTQGEVKVTVREGGGYAVGDTIRARDHNTGIAVRATVSKKIVKVDGGLLSVEYEASGALMDT